MYQASLSPRQGAEAAEHISHVGNRVIITHVRCQGSDVPGRALLVQLRLPSFASYCWARLSTQWWLIGRQSALMLAFVKDGCRTR